MEDDITRHGSGLIDVNDLAQRGLPDDADQSALARTLRRLADRGPDSDEDFARWGACL
jgi:hypothetical protein